MVDVGRPLSIISRPYLIITRKDDDGGSGDMMKG